MAGPFTGYMNRQWTAGRPYPFDRGRSWQMLPLTLLIAFCAVVYRLICWMFRGACSLETHSVSFALVAAPAPTELATSSPHRRRRERRTRHYHLMRRVRSRAPLSTLFSRRSRWFKLFRPRLWPWKEIRAAPATLLRYFCFWRTPKSPPPEPAPNPAPNPSSSQDSPRWSAPVTKEEKDAVRREDYERLQHKFLHSPDIMFEAQFGISLDDYVEHLGNPSAYPRLCRDIQSLFGNPLWSRQQMLLAASLFSRTNDVSHLTAASIDKQPIDYDDTSFGFLAGGGDTDLPVVIDSGASRSLTPNLSDFVGPLRECSVDTLKGLGGKSLVVGVGTVEWTIRDLYGKTGKVRTEAYYVPSAEIRLFSPQTYFQELERSGGTSGYLLMNHSLAKLQIDGGDILTFPYQQGCNLPFMLPSVGDHNEVGMEPMSSLETNLCFVSVVDETNPNITVTQKELLKIHQRLGHCDMSRIQSFCAQPHDKTLPVHRLKTN